MHPRDLIARPALSLVALLAGLVGPAHESIDDE